MGSEERNGEESEQHITQKADQGKVAAPVGYNTVFEELFDRAPEGKETIIGAVAYALYKSGKREWMSDFREREGRSPRDDEMRAYHAMWTPSLLEGKRLEALRIIDQFSQSLIDGAKPAILKEAVRGTVGRAIWLNVASNALYTLLVLGAVLIIAITGLDVPALLRRLAQVISSS